MRLKSFDVASFFQKDIWSVDTTKTNSIVAHVYSLLRIIYLVFSGFLRDQCMLRASSLTFTTVLSIVPFIAVAFSILKGMGFQDSSYIHDILINVSAGRAEVVTKILEYVDNTKVQTLGWLGVATLLMTVLSTVSSIEKSFNVIWKVKKGRTFWRKFTDFFSVIFICPIAILVATSVSVSIRKQEVMQYIHSIYGVAELEGLLLNLAPLLIVWLSFTFVYAFIPNTKVKFWSAFSGGVIAGTCWQVAQWAYINWQVGARNYNAIYGSFAQLPLFLLWVYLSWIILLLGAQITYAVQNIMIYRQQKFMPEAGSRDLQKFALLATIHITKYFIEGKSVYSLDKLSGKIDVPVHFLKPILEKLTTHEVLIRSTDNDIEEFGLAKSPEKIKVLDIVDVMSVGNEEYDLGTGDISCVEKLFSDIENKIEETGLNYNLVECVAILNCQNHNTQ